MISFPIVSVEDVLPDEAMPPPAACKSSAKKSQLMKSRVYVRGLKKDIASECTITILDRQR
jgi:hypothetical protein